MFSFLLSEVYLPPLPNVIVINSRKQTIGYFLSKIVKLKFRKYSLVSLFTIMSPTLPITSKWRNTSYIHMTTLWDWSMEKRALLCIFLIYKHGRKTKWQPTDMVQVKPHSIMRSSRPSLSEELNASFDAIERLKNDYIMMKGVKMQKSIILMESCHYVKTRWVPSTGLVSLQTKCASKSQNNSLELDSLKKLIP